MSWGDLIWFALFFVSAFAGGLIGGVIGVSAIRAWKRRHMPTWASQDWRGR